MRFQQKQQHEIQQKRSEMAISRNISALDINDNSKLTATLGAGKVRQMFDERRQRTTTGIDKSYPLQPITSRKSPTPATNMVKSNSTLSNGKQNADLKFKLQRLPASADGLIQSDKLNGNYTVLNKQNGFGDAIDNEKFPDFFDDDSMHGNKSVPFKLPNVRRPVSSINKPNGNLKLKPVVAKTTIPPKEVMAKRPVITKKLAPVAISSPSNPPIVAKASKSVTSITAKTNDVKEPATLPRGNSSESQKAQRTIATPPENMAACEKCGRFFNEDRILKHESICKKQKKRKVFDVTKHRVQGTDAEVYVKKALKASPKKQAAAPPAKKSNWRKKHEEFIAAIRSAKQVQAHLAAGGKLSDLPPPPPSENADYVQCPHCSRRFNQTAADRHIPKCANFQFNKSKPVAKKKY
ncbi:Zinc finger C2HC domain-containing protein 1C [Pseudolycoriella hygida]|uniref:Zinc finger C2HC domain-containing protein 1C n=1 Tax=Pseudolycoriella hygida TaxID=35572 RepID=A0A9Q0MX10_9DIPT|nr:Zinc finger C2HC domain-containing protein 1C [Pseudolycoriella hygida]